MASLSGFSGSDAAEPPAPRPDLEGLQPSPELLEYYRQRVAAFERERGELLQRVESIGVSRAELHQTTWEAKKRTEEVQELQKALSDAHTYLFDERERLLAMQAENDELKLQEVEDRRRIQHLLALLQPSEQEITFSRDAPPDVMLLYSKGSGAAACAPGAHAAGPAPPPPHMQQPPQPCERVMRTVYLPVANTETLILKIESLQAQLNEQKKLTNERVAALLEDRRIRECDEESRRNSDDARFEALTAKLKRTEQMLQAATKDYIVMRKQAQDADAKCMEQFEEIRQERAALHEEKQAARLLAEQSAREARLAVEKEYIAHFRAQKNEIHSAVAEQYERRIAYLEGQLKDLKGKHKALERRRALDLEGFTSDASTLRKQLAAIDRRMHAMRLAERLEDDERLDALLDAIERRGVANAPTTPNKQRGGKRYTAADIPEDLASIRGRLAGLEARLLPKSAR